MYRTLYTTLICLGMLWPALTYARQDSLVRQRHQFSVGYGTLTADHHLVGYHVVGTSSPDFGNKGIPGAVSLGYKYMVNNTVYLGVTATVEQQHGDWLSGRNGLQHTQVIGSFVRSSFTIAAELTCNYVAHDMYRVYLTAGIGSTMGQSARQYNSAYYATGYYDGVNTYGPMRTNQWGQHMNGQLSPLGISVGRRLCYFVELGYGYKGVINAGLTYSIK